MDMPRLSFGLLAAAFVVAPLGAHAQSPSLPPGPGKDAIEAVCTGCHQTNLIGQSSGYTREHWKELIGTMIDLKASPEALDEVTRYLAAHFPPNTKRPAKPMPGNAQITFTEWQTPTLGQRTRDPIEGPDGSIWWVGQYGSILGRLNPNTGEMKEWPLPPTAKPHTVEIDPKGRPWYTGNMNGTVGWLDPETGKITEYKMPDPNAKDPHTLVFDKQGVAWFSLQNSNMMGRLDPATGEIKLIIAPLPNSKPYGVKIDAAGTVWMACNGAPCLYKIDPTTLAVSEVKLPTPGTTVRRLDIAEDGLVWFVNSGMGKIGRVDPKTGEIKEWDSPSGPKSHPYGLIVVDGIVWYNESGVRPDMLVRFDPKTEKFQSWPIASGGVYSGIWRHGRATRDGNLLIHQSATNRIIRVNVKGQSAEPAVR